MGSPPGICRSGLQALRYSGSAVEGTRGGCRVDRLKADRLMSKCRVFRACLLPLTASPAEFLSFYGLLNFYLYTLAFVYSPSKTALYGKPPGVRQLGSSGRTSRVPSQCWGLTRAAFLLSGREEQGCLNGELRVSVTTQPGLCHYSRR